MIQPHQRRLFGLLLSFACAATQSAWANSYCDNRQTQRDYESCYQANIQAQSNSLEKNYRAVIDHPNLPAENKSKLEQNQDEWTNSVNSQCRDYACTLNALEMRNSQLRQLYKELQGPTAPAQPAKKVAQSPHLSLDELKVAIRKDRKYDIGFGQAPNPAGTRLDYVGVITYRGQQYAIPADRLTEIIPTYIHTGEVSEYGTILIPGGGCNDTFCKDSNNEILGVLPSFWEELKRQMLIPSDATPAVTSAASSPSTGGACYEQKMSDFRKENGEEAMIIHDQIVEWQEQCGLPTE